MKKTNCSNADLLGDIRLIIDVDLVKLDALCGVLPCEFLKHGGDGSARTTPRGPKVNENDFATADLQ